jgi:hypothetical protein
MSENLTKPSVSTFQKNGFYEDLITLRETNPKAFKSMSPATKYALAAYESAKRKAEQDSQTAA